MGKLQLKDIKEMQMWSMVPDLWVRGLIVYFITIGIV